MEKRVEISMFPSAGFCGTKVLYQKMRIMCGKFLGGELRCKGMLVSDGCAGLWVLQFWG